MVFDRFTKTVSMQALGLAITPLVFYWVVIKDDTLVTSVSLVIIWISQIVYLLYFVRKTNNEIARFLTSVTQKEISQHYDIEKGGKTFERLYRAFNMVFQTIREARIKKEAEHQYLLNTIKNVGIGLISLDASGKIELYNDAAAKIFNRPKARKIEDLEKSNRKLVEAIRKVRPNKHELIKLQLNGEMVHLSVKGYFFKIESREIKLITVQDIRSEIEAGEVEAWQKLIKVLTHEITNSISPINLLSSTLLSHYETYGNKKRSHDLDEKLIRDSITGLQAIRKRSTGLKKFIESYTTITHIPEPKYINISVRDMFENISALLNDELEKIDFSCTVSPSDLLLFADEKMVEQVIINLLKNSVYALRDSKEPCIKVTAFVESGKTIIRVTDNGSGIEDANMENIFVPFYSTREGGTGIGLSLSRQIMKLHKGNIAVVSEPHINTSFSLVF